MDRPYRDHCQRCSMPVTKHNITDDKVIWVDDTLGNCCAGTSGAENTVHIAEPPRMAKTRYILDVYHTVDTVFETIEDAIHESSEGHACAIYEDTITELYVEEAYQQVIESGTDGDFFETEFLGPRAQDPITLCETCGVEIHPDDTWCEDCFADLNQEQDSDEVTEESMLAGAYETDWGG